MATTLSTRKSLLLIDLINPHFCVDSIKPRVWFCFLILGSRVFACDMDPRSHQSGGVCFWSMNNALQERRGRCDFWNLRVWQLLNTLAPVKKWQRPVLFPTRALIFNPFCCWPPCFVFVCMLLSLMRLLSRGVMGGRSCGEWWSPCRCSECGCEGLRGRSRPFACFLSALCQNSWLFKMINNPHCVARC